MPMCFAFATKTIVATALLTAMLGGCSEYYFDRRDGITLYSGDAMATNRVTHMIDPWPAASGNRNIAYNGEKAAVAAERHPTGPVLPPAQRTTSPPAPVARPPPAPPPPPAAPPPRTPPPAGGGWGPGQQQAQSTVNQSAPPNAGANNSN